MTNWCDNNLIIRGKAAEIRHFKNSLLKDDNQYYPYVSTIPIFSLREEEIDAYIEREAGETLLIFGFRACNLELIEKGPEMLELRLLTGYGEVKLNFGTFFPKLKFLIRFYEPTFNFRGFRHWVRGKVIAEGWEDIEDYDSPPELYDYRHPDDPDMCTKVIVIPLNQLHPFEELFELPEKTEDKKRID